MHDKLAYYFEKKFYTFTGLLIGFVLLMILTVTCIKPFFSIFLKDEPLRVLIVMLLLAWPIVWSILKNYFPKNIDSKIGLVVSITTENNKQKIRLKNDLVKQISNSLACHGLSDIFNIIVLNNHQANILIDTVSKYIKKRAELRQLYTQNIMPGKVKEIIDWERLTKKIQAHFYIWGNIKERLDRQNKYFMELGALVRHSPIPIKTSKQLRDDLNNIFPIKIAFLESFEVEGFKISADLLYLAVRYISGTAALISGDPFTAFKLHNGLDKEFNKFRNFPNIQQVYKKLTSLLVVDLYYQAQHHYSRNKIDDAEKAINKALAINPNDYSCLIFKSLIEFLKYRNCRNSLKYLEKAEKISNGDFTWLYNKAFLYMYSEDFKNGLDCYEQLKSVIFYDQINIVKQCINFNRELLKLEKDKIQSYFIIGFLYFEKLHDPKNAFINFDKFKELAIGTEKYHLLLSKVDFYYKKYHSSTIANNSIKT